MVEISGIEPISKLLITALTTNFVGFVIKYVSKIKNKSEANKSFELANHYYQKGITD